MFGRKKEHENIVQVDSVDYNFLSGFDSGMKAIDMTIDTLVEKKGKIIKNKDDFWTDLLNKHKVNRSNYIEIRINPDTKMMTGIKK